MSSSRAPFATLLFLTLLASAPLPSAGQDGPAFLVRDVDTTGEPIVFDPPCTGFCPPPQELFGSYPSQLLAADEQLYFVADDRMHGAEVWRSDGTAEGTVRSTDVCPGPCGSNPLLLGTLGSELLFWADDGTSGTELWKTDGTVEGTALVREICPGPCDGLPAGELSWLRTDPLRSATLAGDLYFEARPRPDPQAAAGGRIWRTDGTPGGTEEVLDPCGQCEGAECRASFGAFARLGPTAGSTSGSSLLVPARDEAGGRASLWRLNPDGAPELVARSCSEHAQAPHGLVRLGARLLFASWCLEEAPISPPTGVRALYATDGTAGGTELVFQAQHGGDLVPQFRLGARVYLFGPGGLWRTDGTPAGTELALPTPPGVLGIEEPVPFLGAVFFLGVNDDLLFPLWRTETGGRNPRLLLDHSSGELTPMGDLLLFRAFEPGFGAEPWLSDGTEIGTRRIQDVRPGPESAAARSFVRVGRTVFFSADDGVHDRELWAVRLAGSAGTDPPPPPSPALTSPAFPGFRFWVRITAPSGGSRPGVQEAACLPETVCLSGAVPGRSEVFLRIVGPKPNGRLWPTLVKFTTSTVEVWIEQEATGETRYYRLAGARPGVDELPGRFDRQGFEPR